MANKVVINTEANKVTVTQTDTDKRIVKVSAVGPRGEKGEKGDSGVFSGVLTGSISVTGSLVVSSSYVDFLNATYVTGAFSGVLLGVASTASYVEYSNVTNKPSLVSGSSQINLIGISGNTFADIPFIFPNNVTIQGNLTAEQYIVSNSILFITTSFSSGSTIFGNSADDTHQFTGSVNISGGLVVNNLNVLNLSIFRETGSFWATTNNIEITGSTKTKGNLLVEGLISGTFYGDGDNIYFNRIGTNQNNNSNLIIGNWYNNYQYQQTTTFKNSNVIVSGNLTIQSGSILILEPVASAPTPIVGGIYYHLNDGLYVGEN